MRDSYESGSCTSSVPPLPSYGLLLCPLTSCTAHRQAACSQRQTLFRLGLNSATPLTRYLCSSCTQILKKVNTQGSTQQSVVADRQPFRFAIVYSSKVCCRKANARLILSHGIGAKSAKMQVICQRQY